MEQVNKRAVSSRRTDSLKGYQQNCLANSNCIHTASGTFAELSANVKSILGIKKASCANN